MASYQAVVVDHPAIRLSACRAETFPEGIPAAWERLEALVGSLRGRKFYGVAMPEAGQIAYYAGVAPRDEAEIAALGLPTLEIQGGRFARVRLADWEEHREEIPLIFDYLMENFPMRPGGATIEFYRSQAELHLLIPLAEGANL